jgi:hypothetical protein
VIGDPLTSPPIQRNLMPTIPRALNVLDDSQMTQIDTLTRLCEVSLYDDPMHRSELCENLMSYISDVSGDLFAYDARIFS